MLIYSRWIKLLHQKPEPLYEEGVVAAELDYRLAYPNLGMEALEADEGGVVPRGEDVLHHEDVSVKVQSSKLPQPGKPMIQCAHKLAFDHHHHLST